MVDLKFIAIGIFIIAYLLIIFYYNWKSVIVWVSVFVLMVAGIFTPVDALKVVSWNVILLYFGMLFVSEVFLFSKMPDHLATYFASKTKKVSVALIVICVLAGGLSMFLENVAVVLLVAPVAISIAKKCKINPVPLFIGLAISSNLQGTATLIGDPPSMLLGAYAKMTFNDFFWVDGKPGIFFFVQIGAIVSFLVLYWFFHKAHGDVPELKQEKYISIIPSLLIIAMVLSLIIASMVLPDSNYAAGIICCIFGLECLVWYLGYTKGKDFKPFIKGLDYETGIFLIGIFIVVGSLSTTGVVKDLAHLIARFSGDSLFIAFIFIVVLSVILSAFIDNVPFLIAMLPVVSILANNFGANQYLLYFGLLLGVSLGGNITPIGASANIVAMGIMKKEGHHVKFFDFVKIGLPFTIAAVTAACFFMWIVYT